MIEDGEPIEVKCQFCNTAYPFEIEELKEMLAQCFECLNHGIAGIRHKLKNKPARPADRTVRIHQYAKPDR